MLLCWKMLFSLKINKIQTIILKVFNEYVYLCENDEYVRFLENLRILVLKYIDLINMLFGWGNYYVNFFENI